jgi:hypothetical protein
VVPLKTTFQSIRRACYVTKTFYFYRKILLLFLVARRDGKQGCQILIDTIYQNGEKSIQSPQKLPNEHKIWYQMAIK